MTKAIEPALGLDSFSCPHCGALAHQYWFNVLLKSFQKGRRPELLDQSKIDRNNLPTELDQKQMARFTSFLDRFEKNVVTVQYLTSSAYSDTEMINFHLSRCHSCDGFAAWANGRLIYPDYIVEFLPADDIPPDVRSDFIEAGSILSKSPRGAAALLRLCIQKLMPHLGQNDGNLNNDIGNLVTKGLDPTIKEALDVVRVIGNNAVHPGEINLNDTPEVAVKLFTIVNVIVQSMITTPNQIHGLFQGLPSGVKEAIERRDAKS